ncbi:hypothetical protein FCL47_04080 [Desulfopila sp. IMCC35006]|uniref:hypothetical protein n=1 Tax=Desulfopila sp. IMCC35006 TaxID=2569542 RepID=UPI0010AD46A3|nr:hypothetical protein [Desulfopila sp. IMCC35006]TKB27328.1 hypothetical protein FCL47_04080 [Desulfopila sp. IMCC35006]
MMFQPLNEFHPISSPSTVNEVVELLYDDISLRDKVTMAHLTEYELDASVYLVLAKTIRKEFGLYNGNTELLHSCSSYQGREYDVYEDPAMVIIKELWKKVKKTHNLHLVKNNRSPVK